MLPNHRDMNVDPSWLVWQFLWCEDCDNLHGAGFGGVCVFSPDSGFCRSKIITGNPFG